MEEEKVRDEKSKKAEFKRLLEVDLSVKDAIKEKESELIETKYYKELVVNTKLGPVTLQNVFITAERNKEGDMEYHFRWVQENEKGEETIEEKIMLDKKGNVFCIDDLKNVIGNDEIDIDSLFKENDKVKGRLGGVVREEKQKDKDEKEPKTEDEEEKKVEQDLEKQGKDLKISSFRKITDKHLQERMPDVFNNSLEYAIAYSETMGSFVVLQKNKEVDENGKTIERWDLNENVQTGGTNFEPIISVSEDGNKVEQKVPIALLKTNRSNQEIAVTMEAKHYGEIDIETVTKMPCGDGITGHEERLGRSVSMENEGNELVGGAEDRETREKFNYSGRDFNGTPRAQDDLVHGAKEAIQEGVKGTIDKNTEIPGTEFTYGDISDLTGKTIQEIVAEDGRSDKSIVDVVMEMKKTIEEAAKRNQMSVDGYIEELKKADGKTLDEKIYNANGAIERQYMRNNERQH